MASITSISLPAEAVQNILTAYLNAHILRQHMTVTGVECLGDTFVVTLEPAPESAPIVTTTDPITWTYPESNIYTISTPPLVGHLNANSNGHVSSSAATEVTPAEPSKRHTYTPDEDAEILRLAAEGLSIDKIAAELGLTRSGVNYRITRARKLADGAA